MTEYVRVKQAETGHELSVPTSHLEAVGDGAYAVLDKPATDLGGNPLPPKHKQTLRKAGSTSGQQAESDKEKI